VKEFTEGFTEILLYQFRLLKLTLNLFKLKSFKLRFDFFFDFCRVLIKKSIIELI